MAMTGTVKFFNDEKGYGFISPETGGPDVFVHISALKGTDIGTLSEGQKISFEIEDDRRGRGPLAVRLAPVDDETSNAEQLSAGQ